MGGPGPDLQLPCGKAAFQKLTRAIEAIFQEKRRVKTDLPECLFGVAPWACRLHSSSHEAYAAQDWFRTLHKAKRCGRRRLRRRERRNSRNCINLAASERLTGTGNYTQQEMKTTSIEMNSLIERKIYTTVDPDCQHSSATHFEV